jgi:hypothetical protein
MHHIKFLLGLCIVAGFFAVTAPHNAIAYGEDCECGYDRVAAACISPCGPPPEDEGGGGEVPEMPVALVPAFLLAGIWAARSAKKSRQRKHKASDK